MSKAQTKEQQTYPELKAVLDHQEAVARLSLQVQQIDAAIADQEQKLTATAERRPSSDAIEQSRQALYAAEALGQVTEAEREAREAEIAREAEEIKKRSAPVGKDIARIEAALNGLRGQRDTAAAQLQALQERSVELLDPLIVAEAERVCAAYVDAALMVKERFLQLVSLSNILYGLTATHRSPRHFRIDAERFFIPTFELPQCIEMAHPNARGRLFDAENVGYDNGYEDALEQERARLRALGVTLD